MTEQEAREKAQVLTDGGTPSRAGRDKSRAGGWRVHNIQKATAATARWRVGPCRPKYLAMRTKRNKSPKGRTAKRWHRFRSRYGLKQHQYEQMLRLQDHKCAVCAKDLTPNRGTHVDHDKSTGRVRGLLCSRCNTSVVGCLTLGMISRLTMYLTSDFDGRELE
jgi:hypothetical protein